MHIHIGFQCTLPNLQTKPSFSYKHARLRATNTPKAIGKTLSALTAVSGQTPTLNVSLTYPPFPGFKLSFTLVLLPFFALS